MLVMSDWVEKKSVMTQTVSYITFPLKDFSNYSAFTKNSIASIWTDQAVFLISNFAKKIPAIFTKGKNSYFSLLIF